MANSIGNRKSGPSGEVSAGPLDQRAGHPAASVPCGFTGDGPPIGLQIVAPLHEDLRVLQAAAAYERIAPWRKSGPTWPRIEDFRARGAGRMA